MLGRQKASPANAVAHGPFGTRTPVSVVFENIQDRTVAELAEEFAATRAQTETVLQFAALSAETPVSRS
jgi:uncharacterized protein (DUF433 family)